MKTSQRTSLLRHVWFIVLLCCGQQVFAQAPTITSVVPMTGPEKRNVTINGTSFFGGAVTSRTLRLNGVVVQIQSVSANRIVFTVPSGATTGPINVQTNLGSVTTSSDFVVAPGAPPANDSFSTPQLLSGASGLFDGNTANATKELGEPDHGGVAGGASVWFSWTAPSSGPFLFNPHDTTATNFGVNLAVYTGTALNNLVPVTSAFAGISTSRYKSAVAFNATAGVTYLIALDGFNGIMGDFRLTWSPLAPPTATTLNPSSGYAGQSFTITGTGFTPTTQVIIGGATVTTSRATANSPTSISVSQIPYPAATGSNPITLITLAGPGTSTGNFNVLAPPAPVITTFSPSSGAAGTTTVSFTGTALSLGDGSSISVSFNGAYANPVTIFSGTSVSAKVPSGATTGPITLQTSAGSVSTSTFTVTSSYLPPVVFGSFPTSGSAGSTVSIPGQNFYGATGVLFNGVSAAFTFDSYGQVITATVPAGATTGPITVINPAGSASSPSPFTVTTPPPVITSFSPSTITFGTSVVITGANFTSANEVSFNGVSAASFTVDSSSQITAVVPATVLTDGPIRVSTPAGAVLSAASFTFVPPPPTISSFTPTFIADATTVVITGTNFYNVQSVSFNGTPAGSFLVDSDTQISAVAPPGPLPSGPLTVTTTGGTAVSAVTFSYVAPPTITNFSPAQVAPGVPVTITGTNFFNVFDVSFNGAPAASFIVNSPTQITAIMPSVGVAGGPITVTSPLGTATSAGSFTPVVTPIVASFSPSFITPGQSVVITGGNFQFVQTVRFNGVATSFTVNSVNQITATAPATLAPGPITVVNNIGTGTSLTNYTVNLAPAITGVSTVSGPVGRIITVTGVNFNGNGITSPVPKFNGLSVGSFSIGNTTLTFAVPAGATTGPITLQTSQGFATSPFNFTVLSSGTPPSNDNFANALVIAGPTGTFNGNNVFATKEPGEPNHAGNPGGASVWFSWTAPQSGLFLFNPSATGSQFGITQSIYTGSSVATLTQVASGLTPPNIFVRYASAAVLNAVAGTTYYIALDGFNGVMADYRLTWAPLAAPTISSFSPSGATAGQSVTVSINGNNFTPGAPVSFGGGIADPSKVTYQSQTFITVSQVPITALTGPILVTTPAGVAVSPASFNVTPPPAPTISSFNPDNGIAGTQVTITGTNFTGTSAVLFNGAASSFTVATSSTITATVPTGATSGVITVVAPGGSAMSAIPFTIPLPTISDFSPATITDGTSVTINGTNFINVLAVAFNGIPASSFSVVSSTQLIANAPVGPLTNGLITVTTTAGTATSAASFTYVPPPPTLTSFSPTTLAPGLSVTLTGTGFTGTTSVKFNGVNASFAVNSNTQITATTPSALSAGAIVVTTPLGTATSATNYTVTLAPIITGVSTPSGPVGRIITVNGSNFSGTGISGLNVRVNGTPIGSFSSSVSTLTFAVPAGATTGPITVQTNQGLATSPFTFTVLTSGTPPANDSFANAQLITGTSGTFNGNNVFATKEPGEPNHSNNPGGTSVWFSWTAPQNGFFLFNPSNSSSSQFGIMQSIYTGSSVNSLTLVASGLTPTNVFVRYNAAAAFNAVAGTTYYIALDGYNGVMADYRLTWSPLSPPVIASVSPSSGTAGQTITISISGSNFTPGAPVTFGGGAFVDPTKITYQSPSLITVTQIPITAVTGPILVTTPTGVAVSPASFNVTLPPAPTIAGFTPDVGPVGTTVTINGTNFAGTSVVRFNGTAATSFTVAANGQSITTTVPVGASAGPITVVAPGGTATSATVFTVASPPVIAQQPQMQTTTYGQSATFTVAATSVLPLSYDWRKNGVSIGSVNPTASTASLVISSATMADAAAYDCVVTNALGSVVSTAATLTVNPALATVTLTGMTATYDGLPKPVTVTTNPPGLSVQIEYDGSPNAPTQAGPHQVIVFITDPNYYGANGGYLVINKAAAAISLTNLTATYNGSPRAATVTTVPAGLNVNVTYGGSPTVPTNAGDYAVVATINDFNYSGTIAGTLTISKASATLVLNPVTVTYDGQPHAATATTVPAGLGVNLVYNLVNPTPPTDAGTYSVLANIVDNNYSGFAIGSLSITPAPVTIGITNLAQTYDGTPKSANVTVSPANVGLNITYDGSNTAPTNAGSYAVAVSVVGNNNYTGSASATLVIGKGTASVALGALSATYDSTPHAATATTTPANLNVSFTYDGNATAPTNAGSYAVAATINDNNYTGFTSGTLSIAKASASVALGNLAQTYDGSPKSASVTTTPLGVATALTYDSSATAPTNAGSYAVAANVTDPNYTGSANGTLTIAKGAATLSLGGLAQTYDGSSKSVTATTSPAGLSVAITYDGGAIAPTNAGSYAVAATITSANYSGSAAGVLVIAKGTATIALGDLVQSYNGQPRVVTTSTMPTGLNVSVTYDGSTEAPTNPGSYAVVATIADANRAGTTSGTLVVGITALVRHAPSLDGGIDGSLQVLLGEDAALNGTAYISGDLLVPGTPALRLNGHATVAGTRDGTGNASPSSYQVTLNGSSLLRYLVRRIDAIALPTVATPPADTHDVTLNGNTGSVVLPAGAYNNVTASGTSTLVLGVAGASEPAVYNLQNLTLNGGSQLQIVGPVVLNLANGTSFNNAVGGTVHPEWLALNVASGGVTLNGGATFHGYIAAPNGTVTINANSTLHGRVACDRLVITGNGLLDGR